MYFVFDRFNDNLFTANHVHNLKSTPFSIGCSSFNLLLAQNIFVSSVQYIYISSFDII